MIFHYNIMGKKTRKIELLNYVLETVFWYIYDTVHRYDEQIELPVRRTEVGLYRVAQKSEDTLFNRSHFYKAMTDLYDIWYWQKMNERINK